ncbi:MAG: WD40/YVTN/BNR-like repeat-containing protein [Acidobacteriota bacterium]
MNHIFLATTGRGVARAEQAADGAWTVESLLADRDVLCLAADPLTRRTAFAGTRGRGVLRSDDGGKSWIGAGLAGRTVKAIAASRAEPGVLYAGLKPPLLMVSRDGGANWVEIESFRMVRSRWWRSPAESDLGAYIQGLALSPSDPNVIVVGIEAGAVLRTADGGETWERHRPGAVRDCHSLTFHSTDGAWVYEAGGTGVGASYSRDGGRTWKQPREGLDRHYGWACAADPVRPEVWYVSASPMFAWSHPFVPVAHVDGEANAYIFRSAGGAPWQKLGGGLPQPLDYMAYALLTDPNAPGHVYAGLSNGAVWHSANYGDAWEKLPFKLPNINRTMIALD